MRTILVIISALAGLAIVGLWYGRRFITAKHVMSAYSKDAVDTAVRSFNVKLDYSEESLVLLEGILARQHAEYVNGAKPPQERLETFCKMWGAYLGEVIRRQHGGEWSTPTDGPFQGLYVLTVNGMQISPSDKVYKRLVDGDGDNVHMYYQVLTGELQPLRIERP